MSKKEPVTFISIEDGLSEDEATELVNKLRDKAGFNSLNEDDTRK